MTTVTTPPTRTAVSARRARIVGDAVISAYIRELAPARRELAPAAAPPSALDATARADAREEVRRMPVDHRRASARRLTERCRAGIRPRSSQPFAAGERPIAA